MALIEYAIAAVTLAFLCLYVVHSARDNAREWDSLTDEERNARQADESW